MDLWLFDRIWAKLKPVPALGFKPLQKIFWSCTLLTVEENTKSLFREIVNIASTSFVLFTASKNINLCHLLLKNFKQ